MIIYTCIIIVSVCLMLQVLESHGLTPIALQAKEVGTCMHGGLMRIMKYALTQIEFCYQDTF